MNAKVKTAHRYCVPHSSLDFSLHLLTRFEIQDSFAKEIPQSPPVKEVGSPLRRGK